MNTLDIGRRPLFLFVWSLKGLQHAWTGMSFFGAISTTDTTQPIPQYETHTQAHGFIHCLKLV